MRLLCFDPGTTTGIAILDGKDWKMGMTVPEESVDEVLFRCLVMLAEPHVVVVETLPTYMAHEPSHHVHSLVKQWFETAGYIVDEVNPGQWKGMSDRLKISGTHQVDAATMGLWYYGSRLVNIFHE